MIITLVARRRAGAIVIVVIVIVVVDVDTDFDVHRHCRLRRIPSSRRHRCQLRRLLRCRHRTTPS